MVHPDGARWLIASAGAHLGVVFVLLAMPAPLVRGARPDRVEVSELRFDATPAPRTDPPPTPPETAPPPAAMAQPPRVVTRAPPPRVVRAEPIAAPPREVPPEPPPVAPPPLPPAPPAPALRVTDLLRASASNMAFPMRDGPAPTAPDRGVLFEGSRGTELDRARAASQGYVREVLTDSTHREAPGVRAYLWNVRRRVAEVWRPGVVRVPNLGETLLSGFIAPERAIRILGERVMRRQRQVLEAPGERLGGAVDAIEAIGGVAGNGPTGRQGIPSDTGAESWRRNTRTTRVEVQVDQDPNGRVLDVRVVRSSGMVAFDRAAVAAVREGVDAQDPVALPGGRSSRWSFTVVATRRLFAPSIGGTFDESRGWFQVQLPGQVSVRSRVQMESSAPLDAAPRS
jgi:TonB family protein